MYNKIFTKILDSSVWLEPDATRIVWLTCIAAMDEDGFVQMASVENLARRANVSLDACHIAVTALEAPDKVSSDKQHKGRRLKRIAGGWIVLNAQKYRLIVSRAVQREQTRLRVQKHRIRTRKWQISSMKVTHGNAGNEVLRKANGPVTPSEAEAEAEEERDRGSGNPGARPRARK